MTQDVVTWYEKLGGRSAVQALAGDFYNRVLTDEHLKGCFAHTDINRQVRRQSHFLAMALGGPQEFDGRSIRDTFENIGLTEMHLHLLAGHLVDTLKWAGMDAYDIDALMAMVTPVHEGIATV